MELVFNRQNRTCVQCHGSYRPWYPAQQQCEPCTQGENIRGRKVQPLRTGHEKPFAPEERWDTTSDHPVESTDPDGGFMVLPEYG